VGLPGSTRGLRVCRSRSSAATSAAAIPSRNAALRDSARPATTP